MYRQRQRLEWHVCKMTDAQGCWQLGKLGEKQEQMLPFNPQQKPVLLMP